MSLGNRTSNGQLADTIKVLTDDLETMTRERNILREMYLRLYALHHESSPYARLKYVGCIVQLFPYGYTSEVSRRLGITERHAGRLISKARKESCAPTLKELKEYH